MIEALLGNDPQAKTAAFGLAIEAIRDGSQWEKDLGGGCNLFHVIAFLPEEQLKQILPDWKEYLELGIRNCKNEGFDKANNGETTTIIKGLLEAGKGIPALNRDTPLGIAIYRGNGEVARVFLENGADIYHKNATGNRILHLAAASGVLVDEITRQVPLRAFESTTLRGQTPEQQAEQHNSGAKEIISERYAQLKNMVQRWVNNNGTNLALGM